MSTESAVIRLSSDDRAEIVEVLARSFHEYPVFRYVLQDALDDVAYDRCLRSLIGFFVDARLMRDWPVLGIRERGDLVAAMILSDPVFKPRPEALDRVYQQTTREVGGAAIRRLEQFESASAQFEPKSRTYFVGMIGVDPSSQGKGHGRRLMERVETISRSRVESEGVTLTTEVPENIPFYESLGYRVIGSAGVGDITTWFFLLEH
jgi:GNAT superfamily N-acetyltransferase